MIDFYVISYVLVGICLSIYWFDHEYVKKYEELRRNGKEEDGMTNIFMAALLLFWPIKLIKNLILRKQV